MFSLMWAKLTLVEIMKIIVVGFGVWDKHIYIYMYYT